MANNPTGFKITNNTVGWNCADFDDVFVRKDCFLEGGLWIWGNGASGRLGNNNTTSHSSPVQTVSGGTNWRSVAAGSYHSASIKSDGSLWLWGCGNYGTLGDNSTISSSSPVQTVSGGTNWRSVVVSAGSNQNLTAAIKTDGSLWLWGTGSIGILGNNSTASRSSPVQTISGGNNWRSVSLGANHSAAIKTDGSLWLWGINNNGNMGDNSLIWHSSPVQTISGGTNWRSVSLGTSHSAAIKTDGSLWLWGLGTAGQLGNDDVTSRSSPVQTISGGTNWRSVSLGSHNAAIKTDGSLWLWGTGAAGSLGNDDVTSRSSPVQTISGGTNWRNLCVRGVTSAAIKTDGSLWLWGQAEFGGKLGDNSIINKSSPVQTISGGTNWSKISNGASTILAIREDCW